MSADFIEPGWLNVVVSVLVAGAALLFARRVVDHPTTRKPFEPHMDDVGFFAVGALVMLASGWHREASTWVWFIDLASFAVAASLVATTPSKSIPRRIGLVILGLHLAEVLATDAGSPLNQFWSVSPVATQTPTVVGIEWWPVGVAVAIIVGIVVMARGAIRNETTRAKLEVHKDDGLMVAFGAAGMVLAGFLQKSHSVYDIYVDGGAVAIGAVLFAVSKVESWPRRVGLLIIGIHLAEALVTDAQAPLQSLVVLS